MIVINDCEILQTEDERGWLSWRLDTEGSTMSEMIRNATITALDPDATEVKVTDVFGFDDEANMYDAIDEMENRLIEAWRAGFLCGKCKDAA